MPRVWLMIANENRKSADWQDKLADMSRENIMRREAKEIRIRLPSCVNHIWAGFNSLDQKYVAELSDDRKTRQVNMPLRGFADYSEIAVPLHQETALRVRLGVEGEIFPVIHIPADVVKPPTESDSFDFPEPLVKTSMGKFRRGKGFSAGELRSVERDRGIINRRHIRFDKRRKSVHRQNVETLTASR